MKVKIDNNILEVKIINKNYNSECAEVEILEGNHKGVYCIVKKSDLIKPKKTKRFLVQVQDFNYSTGKWSWKNYVYYETIEEARRIKLAYSNIGSRILDRENNEYI